MDHSIELNPDASLAYSVKAAAAAHAGRRAEGLELIAKALRLEPTLTLAQLERRIRYFFPKRSPVFEEWLALTGLLWAEAEVRA